MDLREYLNAERGRVNAVAAEAAIAAAFLSQIANGVRQAPAQRCADIERATGGAVRRWDLRPLDWHRIWPELLAVEGAPAVEVRDAA